MHRFEVVQEGRCFPEVRFRDAAEQQGKRGLDKERMAVEHTVPRRDGDAGVAESRKDDEELGYRAESDFADDWPAAAGVPGKRVPLGARKTSRPEKPAGGNF